MKSSPSKYIIGIDEVGRGPLAGPVTVGAVLLKGSPPAGGERSKDSKKKRIPLRKKLPLRDSKKLSVIQREAWVERIEAAAEEKLLYYAVVSVSPKTVDRVNISQAANRAATKALEKLLVQIPSSIKKQCCVFLDGGLYLNPSLNAQSSILKTRTIVRGDETIQAISLASIVAKVARDRIMKRLHKKYPQYGFHIHKGYGTKLHQAAITKYGLSAAHRLTFTRKYHKLNK